MIRRFLSPKLTKKIMHSLPFRIFQKYNLKNHPINFSVELTTKCNAICDMCTRQELVKKRNLKVGDIEPEIIKRILQEMKKFVKNKKKIFFSPMGLGEPFLFKDWENLFKKIKKISKKIPIVIATNGILLNKKTAKKLIQLEIDEIIISLNSNNPEDYLKQIGVNTYEKVIQNTRNLIKLRNQSGKKIPRIFIQYLDYDNNPDKFNNNIKNWLKIMKYDDKCYVHSIANQAGFYKGKTFISNKKYPCNQPLWRIAIKINGDIYPCDPCFYSGSKKISSLYIGNIKDRDLYEQFFNKNSKRLKILEQMKNSDYSDLPECEKCNTYKLASNPFFKVPFSKKWF